MQSLPPGLRLVGSVYHLRIGIPDKVRHLWPRQKNGKLATDAFRASLKTSDRADAITQAHKLISFVMIVEWLVGLFFIPASSIWTTFSSRHSL
ncbi:DUF6538 domain-containing protein [Burkholderia stagnalis]